MQSVIPGLRNFHIDQNQDKIGISKLAADRYRIV